jgi:hypothetical protein
MHTAGALALRDTIRSGGDIARLLNSLHSDATQETTAILTGSVSYLLTTYLKLRDANLAPRFVDEELDQFMQAPATAMAATLTQKMSRRGTEAWVSSRLTAMVHTVNLHREKLTFPEPVAIAPAPPEPIAVRVVGMPDRVTESSVKYDADGNIKSTTQTERDAAPKA